MYTEIKRKKLMLENRKPYKSEAVELAKEQNQFDLIWGSLLLEGILFKKEDILNIVRGEYVVSLSINDHILIRNYCDIFNLLNEMSELGEMLDEKSMVKIYHAFIKNREDVFRSSNPVLHSIDYIPPHFKEIQEQMKLLFDFMKDGERDMNPIIRAAYMHNKLIEIYPFESGNLEIARFALQYELIRNGLPIVMLDMKEQEYFDLIRRYIKTEDASPLYEKLAELVLKKQEFLLSITNIN